MTPLVQHALDSIVVGVEDFETETPARDFAAVRNIMSGTMLLVKAVILENAPAGTGEALIYERVTYHSDDSGKLVIRGSGKKTVDVTTAVERLKNLGVEIGRARLDKLQAIRNDIEHYLPPAEAHVKARDAVATAFALIAQLLDHLELVPAEVLGDAWSTMMQQADLIAEVRKDCDAKVASLTGVPKLGPEALQHISCASCESDRIAPENDNDSWDPEVSFR